MTLSMWRCGFKDIISGVAKGSIVGLVFFNAYLDDFFFFFALEKYLPTILLMTIFYHHWPGLLKCYWKY